MAGVLYKLDRTGHGEQARWSNDRISQERARTVFNRLRDNGHAIADLSRDGVFIREFDPTATELLAVPQLVSG